ncbi:MAG TPA: DUF6036 family nucleotidyltransferase [Tepidisphaeraceae bacterium]|jgi:hypothetical protein
MELNVQTVREALSALGDRLHRLGNVEIVISGGGSALLSGALPPTSVTADIDVIFFRPPADNDEILRLAGEVGRERSLAPDWLNEHARLYFHELPRGWEHRTTLVGEFRHLKVLAIGRRDFIAMKFYAHRAGDLEHLKKIDPPLSPDDLSFVLAHFAEMEREGIGNRTQIEMARMIVTGWAVS